MNCSKCGNEIPAERLEILPNTTTCVNCSTVKPKKGVMVWNQKTAPELATVDGDDEEAIRISKLRTWH